MPARIDALDLPEIHSLISNYLIPQDLYACIQVSHSFHSAFTPPQWSTIRIQPAEPPKISSGFPSQQALTRYKHLVRGLHLTNVFPEFYSITFQDTLQDFRFATLNNRQNISGVNRDTIRLLIRAIKMNANSLTRLSVDVTIPDESVEESKELWEAITNGRRVETIELANLEVSLRVLDYFRTIAGDGTSGSSGGDCLLFPSTSEASSVTRSVQLHLCIFDEWPDELYADETFTLPFITSMLIRRGIFDRKTMSLYGQARMVRKCVNLRILDWMTFDVEPDHERATRWGVESGDDVDWFIGGLLGDTPTEPGEAWKNVTSNQQEEQDQGSAEDVWPLPFLDSITTDYKQIPDLMCARLLKRLHRLVTLRLRSPLLGPLAMEELFRKRAPFRSSPLLGLPLPRRLSSMLKHLDLASSRYVVSDHVHQVLECCPLLEEFRAPIVDMTGILDRPAWVCCGIRVLALGFIFYDSSPTVDGATADAADADATTTTSTTTASLTTASNTTKIKELEWAVFSRLSQLFRLKSFLNTIFDAPPETHLLQLRLEYGLELLAGWAETLEDVTLSCYNPQNMAMDDIQWILDHWPKLRSIVCRMYNADVAVNTQIKDALTSKGIRLRSQYPF
ncbi:MAG: hypothetical protein J3R72DRAFT_459079 [Linnemannia gamsii]|nr:MAG: hypothetical protein J3R72DRAFT_459079 [Linnemannia gamsii]